MQQTVLKTEGLTRRFGSVLANDGIDLTVRPGQIVGLLGENGAGKTTLVSQVVGLLRPDGGSIQVAGIDAVANPAKARRCIGIQAQSQAPLDGLTPTSAIVIAARLRGLSRSQAKAAAADIAEALDIGQWMNQRVLPGGGGLSGGVRRLTSFAMAIAAPVPLVILDEPTNDVDPARRKLLWNMLRTLADRGTGVLLVTHNVMEAERVVDQLAVLDSGRVVAAGTPSQLRGSTDRDLRLELVLASDAAALPACPVSFNRKVETGRSLLLTIDADQARQAVAWAAQLRAAGHVDDYSLTPSSLEDAYLALTSGQHAASVDSGPTAAGPTAAGPGTSTSSSGPAAAAPTPSAAASTPATSAPHRATPGTDTPTPGTDAPTPGTDTPTPGTDTPAPTSSPTGEPQ